MATPECVIFVGLPGSGKSTLYRDKFAATHTHVSKDLWPNATKRDARQLNIVDAELTAGRSVVVDNTNPTRAERAAIINVAKSRGARVTGYFFDVTTRAAVARNGQRTAAGKVPNVAIFTTAKRLEKPIVEEGFDELFRVEIAEDRSLRIASPGA